MLQIRERLALELETGVLLELGEEDAIEGKDACQNEILSIVGEIKLR